MNKAFFILCISLVFVSNSFAQLNFKNQVHQLLLNDDYKNASIGIHITDLETQKTIFGLNEEKMLIPASTLKLLTSATAIELLGSDYQFETRIGYSGMIENGVLNGNLILIGGADPTLGSEYFQDYYFDFLKNWSHKIKEAGIRKVKGDIILDGSVYDTERVPDTWIWGDIGNYYGAGPNAFTIYDNLFRITFRSPKKVGKLTKITAVYPKIKGMEIDNEVRSANSNSDNAYVFGGPLDKSRVIRGTIPRNRTAFTIKAAIQQPEEIVAKEFLKALANDGIFVSGESKFEKVNEKKVKTLFIQESPKLAQIAEVLNHESVNLFAEHLLKQIAVEKNGLGNRNDAIALLKEYWNSKGVSTNYLFMEDGSGLSHFNAVSPAFFTQLLTYMAKNQAFINSLPLAGEGTLKRFDKKLFPGNVLQAKSGSMTRVRCYAGYLHCDSGKTLVFSFMFNHFSGVHSTLVKQVEELLHFLKTTS